MLFQYRRDSISVRERVVLASRKFRRPATRCSCNRDAHPREVMVASQRNAPQDTDAANRPKRADRSPQYLDQRALVGAMTGLHSWCDRFSEKPVLTIDGRRVAALTKESTSEPHYLEIQPTVASRRWARLDDQRMDPLWGTGRRPQDASDSSGNRRRTETP
jgi:hypothetical protein